MGRKKIKIEPITNEYIRRTTFNKRKDGILKKVAELSMLCEVNIHLVITNLEGGLIIFENKFNQFNIDQSQNFISLLNYQNDCKIFSLKDYPNFYNKKTYNKVVKKSDKSLDQLNQSSKSLINQNSLKNQDDQKKDKDTVIKKLKQNENNETKEMENLDFQNKKQNIQQNFKNKLQINIPKDNENIKNHMKIIKIINQNQDFTQPNFQNYQQQSQIIGQQNYQNNTINQNLINNNIINNTTLANQIFNFQSNLINTNSAFKVFKSPIISQRQILPTNDYFDESDNQSYFNIFQSNPQSNRSQNPQ